MPRPVQAAGKTGTLAMAAGHAGMKAQLLLQPCLQGVGEGNEWGFSCTYVRAMGTQKVQRRPQLVSAARSLSLVLRRLLPPLAYLTVTDVITGRHTRRQRRSFLFRWWAPVGVGRRTYLLVLPCSTTKNIPIYAILNEAFLPFAFKIGSTVIN